MKTFFKTSPIESIKIHYYPYNQEFFSNYYEKDSSGIEYCLLQLTQKGQDLFNFLLNNDENFAEIIQKKQNTP